MVGCAKLLVGCRPRGGMASWAGVMPAFWWGPASKLLKPRMVAQLLANVKLEGVQKARVGGNGPMHYG